tara:strand:- start:3442 stop:4494 length:1053 start_codon:yes stop_codon:yes gene_type:complete
MRRILTRPMFRSGGQARQGYAEIGRVLPTEEDITNYQATRPERAPDRSLNDFLINFGLNLGSQTPQGNIFQTAAVAAKEPFQQMQKARYAREGAERDEYNDMYKAIMDAKSDMVGSEGGSNALARTQYAQAGKKLLDDLFVAVSEKDEYIDTNGQNAYDLQIAKIMQGLSIYSGEDADLQALYGNKDYFEGIMDDITTSIKQSEEEITITNADGEQEIVVEGDYARENKAYLANRAKEKYLAMVKQDKINKRLGKAEGGEIKETMTEEVAGPGGMAMASETIEEPITDQGSGLSFEELRARLPREISDDIINILVESPAALVDFAEIQTQMDVDQFNMKYGVNLALPSGA